MKVIQKTENILKLNDRQNLIANALFFAIFTLPFFWMPLFMLPYSLAFSGVERFSCKKVQPTIATCELTQSGLLKGESTLFEGVQKARVDTINSTDSDGKSTSVESVFLVTNQGDILLPGQTRDDVKLFNKYIQTAVGKLVIEKDSRSLSLEGTIGFSIFVFIGAGVTYLVLRHHLILKSYIFDKNTNTLSIKKRGMWVNEVAERSLEEISDLELETTSNSEEGKFYEVRLLMKGGSPRLSLGKITNQKEQQKIADWIRGYLDRRSHADRDTSDPGDRQA